MTMEEASHGPDITHTVKTECGANAMHHLHTNALLHCIQDLGCSPGCFLGVLMKKTT